MTDRNRPSRPGTSDTGVVPRDTPDEIERREELPEGPIPGLPPVTDPLLQPMPKPAPREVPPLD